MPTGGKLRRRVWATLVWDAELEKWRSHAGRFCHPRVPLRVDLTRRWRTGGAGQRRTCCSTEKGTCSAHLESCRTAVEAQVTLGRLPCASFEPRSRSAITSDASATMLDVPAGSGLQAGRRAGCWTTRSLRRCPHGESRQRRRRPLRLSTDTGRRRTAGQPCGRRRRSRCEPERKRMSAVGDGRRKCGVHAGCSAADDWGERRPANGWLRRVRPRAPSNLVKRDPSRWNRGAREETGDRPSPGDRFASNQSQSERQSKPAPVECFVCGRRARRPQSARRCEAANFPVVEEFGVTTERIVVRAGGDRLARPGPPPSEWSRTCSNRCETLRSLGSQLASLTGRRRRRSCFPIPCAFEEPHFTGGALDGSGSAACEQPSRWRVRCVVLSSGSTGACNFIRSRTADLPAESAVQIQSSRPCDEEHHQQRMVLIPESPESERRIQLPPISR